MHSIEIPFKEAKRCGIPSPWIFKLIKSNKAPNGLILAVYKKQIESAKLLLCRYNIDNIEVVEKRIMLQNLSPLLVTFSTEEEMTRFVMAEL